MSTLAERYEISFAAVQKHVAVLERAGLVTKQSSGRERLVHGEVDAVRAAARLLNQRCQPFVWTKDADAILPSARRPGQDQGNAITRH